MAGTIVQSPVHDIIDEMQDIIHTEVSRFRNLVKNQDKVHGVERTMKMMSEALLLTIKCRSLAEAAEGLGDLTIEDLRDRMLKDPNVVATLKQAHKTLPSH